MTTGGLPWPSDPHLRRWMLFVDGENFTCEGQKWANDQKISLKHGSHYKKDIFLWIPDFNANTALSLSSKSMALPLQHKAIRAHYYTSLVGTETDIGAVKASLWDLGFDPIVFKKKRGTTKSKGVDIMLAKDMLTNAFLDNYDTAVLLAGDGDYVPLVEEVKHLGKIVHVVFFQDSKYGLNRNLRLASDQMIYIDPLLKESWRTKT